MILNSPYISGSLTVTGNITAQGGINISGSIASASYAVSASEASKLQGLGSASFAPASTFNTVSQSFAASSASLSTRVTTNETNISTLTSASASFAIVSSSYAAASGSLSTRVTNVETTASVLTSASSSFATMSGSLSIRVTNLEVTSSTVSQSFASTSGSISGRVTIIEGQDATTGSNIFTGPQYVNQASNAISFTSTASLYTDGGLRVSKDSFVSGTAYFNNVVVYGTSSIQYITSSQVNFGTNIITVNTDTPAVRFGGLAVFDSGSTGLTGSMLWDSEKNNWIYSNPSGSSYNSAMLMNGPRNTGSLGTEQGTTACAFMMGQGGDHITSSMIYSYGNATCFYGASFISSSGAACFGNQICAPTVVASTCLAVRAGSATLVANNIAGAASNNHFAMQRNDAQYASIGLNGSDNFTIFGTSTSCPRLIIDGNGNIGVNVTPNAWCNVKALQINAASVGGYSNTGYFNANAYYNTVTNWTYVNTSYAARYELNSGDSGIHAWYVAPSGTAGCAITFCQAMTLGANGNLLIGTTTDNSTGAKLQVTGAATFSGKVFLNTTTAYTSELNVQAIAANRPAIKAGYGGVTGNGYWLLGDNYTTDESLMAIGIDYSSGGLVLGSALAPSTTTSGAFISTQAQFGGYGSAIRLGTSGEIVFYNGTQNSVIAAGSAKTASVALTIAQTGAATFCGDVGIGVTPTAKLDVNGTVYIRTGGILYVDSLRGYTSGTLSTTLSQLALSSNFGITGGNVGIGSTSPQTRAFVLGLAGGQVGAGGCGCSTYSGGGKPAISNYYGDQYGNGAPYGASAGTIAPYSVWYGGGAGGYFKGGDGDPSPGGGGAGIVAIGGNGSTYADSGAPFAEGGAGIYAKGGFNKDGTTRTWAGYFDGCVYASTVKGGNFISSTCTFAATSTGTNYDITGPGSGRWLASVNTNAVYHWNGVLALTFFDSADFGVNILTCGSYATAASVSIVNSGSSLRFCFSQNVGNVTVNYLAF